MGQLAASLLSIALCVGLCFIGQRQLRAHLTLGRLWLLAVALLGVALGAGCFYLERAFWGLSGLSLVVVGNAVMAPLLAMLLFAAPLEEGAKLLLAWGLNLSGRVAERADAVLATLFIGAGFGAAESVLYLQQDELPQLAWLRALLAVLAHPFFATLWGFVLGTRSKLHLLGVTWFSAMLMHGLYDHVVFGRGEGTLVVAVPLLVMMLLVSAMLSSEVKRSETWVDRGVNSLAAPSLRELSYALRRRERPLKMRWIVVGAFVTTGVVLSSLALAVVVGHQMGVDFAAADEGDMRANGPLTLLGAAVMAAFPVAGYLVARASSSHSVIEAAMGAALAIGAVVALLSLAAPVAVVFALAVAPVAFGLACLGAWFGVGR